MSWNKSIGILFVLIVTSTQMSLTENNYDSVTDMIEMAGYPVETHYVSTKDGYILKLHRIPTGRELKILDSPDIITGLERIGDGIKNFISGPKIKPITLVQHGLFCSSADFVVTGPEKALGLILADAGYDVWLGNSRGNTYSRQHIHREPDSPSFWKFSFHEVGVYDLPAMINYVLMKTNQSSLHYIGHSQGVSAVMAMLATKPSYNEKLKTINAMAPEVYMGRIKNPIIKRMVSYLDQLESLLNTFGMYEILPTSSFTKSVGNIICADDSITQGMCVNTLFAMVGFNSDQLNRTLLPKIMENIPAGASWKQLIHYGQMINSGKFQMYDYRNSDGSANKNLKLYGTEQPPEYQLSRVRVPTALYYGTSDNLLSPIDAEILSNDLRNVLSRNEIYGFNHIDFMYGIEANTLVYKTIIETIQKAEEAVVSVTPEIDIRLFDDY